MIAGIENRVLAINGQEIACSLGGSDPAVRLLHGFPQTRALWARVAPRLAERFTAFAADLRGYGASSKPKGAGHDTFRETGREMGRDQLALMTALGQERFHLVGHDRSARTAHRMALDAAAIGGGAIGGYRLLSLTLMDIVPTHHLLDHLDHRVAAAYCLWFFLARPAPLPARLPAAMILADPDRLFESCLLSWDGAQLVDFAPDQFAADRAAWRDPATVGAMCDDYRAALGHDFDIDAADRSRRIACPTLVLHRAAGAVAKAYDVPATWALRLAEMRAQTIPGGHFFIDTPPEATARALLDVLP